MDTFVIDSDKAKRYIEFNPDACEVVVRKGSTSFRCSASSSGSASIEMMLACAVIDAWECDQCRFDAFSGMLRGFIRRRRDDSLEFVDVRVGKTRVTMDMPWSNEHQGRLADWMERVEQEREQRAELERADRLLRDGTSLPLSSWCIDDKGLADVLRRCFSESLYGNPVVDMTEAPERLQAHADAILKEAEAAYQAARARARDIEALIPVAEKVLSDHLDRLDHAERLLVEHAERLLVRHAVAS